MPPDRKKTADRSSAYCHPWWALGDSSRTSLWEEGTDSHAPTVADIISYLKMKSYLGNVLAIC